MTPRPTDHPSDDPDDARPADGGRVLLVDDDPSIARVVSRMLTPRYEVVCETSASAALDRIARDPEFDLVLCDLVLPGMSGMGFLSALRERSPDLASRVAILSGDVTPATRAFAAQTQCGVLEKPFLREELQRFVAERVAARRRIGEAGEPGGAVELLTTQQAAELLGVSPATVKRWADGGLLETRRTGGGHRRFTRASLDRFEPATAGVAEARDSTGPSFAAALLDPDDQVAVEAALLRARSRAGSWCIAADWFVPTFIELHRMREQRVISQVQWVAAFDRLGRATARFAGVMPRPTVAADLLVAVAPGQRLPAIAYLVELCAREEGCRVRWAGGATCEELVEECARARPDAVLVAGSAVVSANDAAQHASALADAQREIGCPITLFGFAPWPETAGISRLRGFLELRSWLVALARAPRSR